MKCSKMRYQIKKEIRTTCQTYPLAILVCYGPNTQLVLQVVVSILPEPQAEAEPIYKWVADINISKYTGINFLFMLV